MVSGHAIVPMDELKIEATSRRKKVNGVNGPNRFFWVNDEIMLTS